MKQNLSKVFLFISILSLSVLAVNPAAAAPHTAGTNVKTSDGTIFLISPDGTRRPYNSAGAFLSYGFNNWNLVADATAEDLALPVGENIPPRDGKIICDTKERVGTCFLITEGRKIAFPSEKVFKGQGFSFDKVLYGDVSFLAEEQNIASGSDAHKPGVLINMDGTIYLVTGQGLMGIPNIATFESWGYSFGDAVPTNLADRKLSVVGTIKAREAGQLNPSDSGSAVKPITITKPASASQLLPVSAPYIISWYDPAVCSSSGGQQGCNATGQYDIYVITDVSKSLILNGTDPAKVSYFVDSVTTNNAYASYSWEAGLVKSVSGVEAYLGTDYNFYFMIKDKARANRYAISPVFQLAWARERISVTSQETNETWNVNSPQTVIWTGGEEGVTVNIFLTSPNSGCTGTDQRCGRVLYTIGKDIPNAGRYDFNVKDKDYFGKMIPSGIYVVRIESTGEYTNGDDSSGKITLTASNLSAEARDVARLADARQMASALELYFNDHNEYPNSSNGKPLGLDPGYIGSLPTAPVPADGSCSDYWNVYWYERKADYKVTFDDSLNPKSFTLPDAYEFTFCLCSYTGGYSSGVHILSPAGIK